MALTSAQLVDFSDSISDNGCELPKHAILDHGVIVDGLDLDILDFMQGDELGIHELQALRNLQARGVTDPADWVVVGSWYEDMTHFCDYENKWELGGTMHVLMVPRSEVEGYQVDFTNEDKAAKAGYVEYAA